MAKLSIKAGSTSVTVNLFIQDSSSTTGAGKTGLAFNTASLTAYYSLPRAAAVSITLATQTATGAWSSGGFVEIDATNMPGWYRFDIPNAALASGTFSSIHFKGAANMAPLPLEIELTAVDNQSATGFVSSVPAVVGAVGSVTGAVGSVTAGVTVTTNNDKTGYTASTVSDKTGYALSATGSAALTEGYAADGAAPTLNQMLYQIWAFLAEKNISGTTLTAKKLDGATTAMTFTLDSSSAPTSITRAT